MPEQRLTQQEHRMMQDAFVYLRDHCCPPKTNSEYAMAWWDKAGMDAIELAGEKWRDHPLITGILVAIYEYIENKSKEVH